MRTYNIQLISTGSLTQLPDSQKLFGALVYMYSERYGGEHASKLTKDLLDKKIYLSLSNVVPSQYIPTPQEYIIDSLSKVSNNNTSLKEKRASIKLRSYIPITNLENILNKSESCETLFPYIKLQSSQQIHAFIESNFYDIPELESKLYSVPTIKLLEIWNDENGIEQKKSVNKFCFYLQVDNSNSSNNLLNMLNKAVSTKKTVILGKRSSQGLNVFKFENIEEKHIKYDDTDVFLNMGMLLPNKIDFLSSTLKLFSSERRPFEMPGGWDKDVAKHYISFIAEGSIIVSQDEIKNTGKSIKSPFNPNRDIVFGNAFLYPLKLEKGRH